MSRTFNGFLAAPPTPMAEDGSLRLGLVERQAGALIANGVAGAFVCGTTGEGVSLSVDERMQVARRWCELAPESFRIIVHVGALALPEAKALAAHAADIGAVDLGTLPSLYFKPTGTDDVLDWCGEIASAAPGLRIYYYHMPAVTGVPLRVNELLSAAVDRLPALAGAKFTHEDMMDFRLSLEAGGGRFELFFGRDQMLLAALATGARQAIGTSYNYAAPLYRRIIDSFESGDLAAARADQTRAAEMVSVFGRHGGLPAMKAAMKLVGVDCGPVRPPLRPLTGAEADALGADLEAVGFFDFCCQSP